MQNSGASRMPRMTALWSQRRDSVTIIIDHRERGACEDEELGQLEGETRDAESGELSYSVLRFAGAEIRLHAPVVGLLNSPLSNVEMSRIQLIKADPDAPFWPALTSPPHHTAAPEFIVGTDWARWVDEDEDEDDAAGAGAGAEWSVGDEQYGDDEDDDEDEDDDDEEEDDDDEEEDGDEEKDGDEEDDAAPIKPTELLL